VIMARVIFRWFFLLLLGVTLFSVTGCSTTEPDNASARPWNQPAHWETGGMPSSMMEGR